MQSIFVQNFSQNQALAPMCLHAAFHDCWNGCNGALFMPEEIDRPENAGLPPLKPYLMPFTSQFPCISIADLINSCAVTALKFLNGPDVPVYYGRLDRNVPDPTGLIPEPTMSLSALINAFSAIGFSKEDVVTLSGAHSVGVCHGIPMCPGHNTSFGNHYYQELIEGDLSGKLPTDVELLEDNTMRSLVQQYANDNSQFFSDFSRVFGKYISRIHCNQTSTGPCPLDDIGNSTTSTSTSSVTSSVIPVVASPSSSFPSSSSPIIIGSPIVISSSSSSSSSTSSSESFPPVPPISGPFSNPPSNPGGSVLSV
ncbi:peroxidase [Galdieria sulphuraria]|uniref:Peroxidase n=2 Tax=Galdieria sulphuraria TaxID=130081 RepID=A5JW35_GALSU|nr:peroxidase [Galdieria sulphuraria]ABQ53880.1 peroxidase [Galdieria sulphuraria]EME27459.1 peroxidase [Galdieria sulphuraria]|eukprot:XP_005703979.1 peroxidase [Galdieria sulphuraria]